MKVSRWIAPLLTGFVCFATGQFLGKDTSQRSTKRSARSNEPGATIDTATSKQLSPAELWLRFADSLPSMSTREFARVLLNPNVDPERANLIAEQWARHDPHGFLEWLGANAASMGGQLEGRRYIAFLKILTAEWCRESSYEAFVAMRNQTGFFRVSGMAAIMSAVFDTDPELGIAAMRGTGGVGFDWSAIERWIERDPAAASVRVNDFTIGPWRGMEFAVKVVEKWAAVDAEAAAEWAHDTTGCNFSKHRCVERAFHLWAEKDPAAAAQAAVGIADIGSRATAMGGVANAWGKSQPHEAILWAAEHLESSPRNSTLATIAKSGSETNAEAEAMEATAAQLPPGPTHAAVMKGIAEARWERDKTATLDWLMNADRDVRNAAGETLRWKVDADDADWIKQVIEERGPDRMIPDLVSGIAMDISHRMSPPQALEWISKLPADLTTDAHSGVYVRWASTNPTAASESAVTQPPGLMRDQALATTFSVWIDRQHDAALQWLGQLPSDDREVIRASIRESSWRSASQKKELFEKIDQGSEK